MYWKDENNLLLHVKNIELEKKLVLCERLTQSIFFSRVEEE